MNSPGSFILVVAGRLTVEFNEVSEPVFQLITDAVKDRELVWKITFCRRRIFCPYQPLGIITGQRFFRRSSCATGSCDFEFPRAAIHTAGT